MLEPAIDETRSRCQIESSEAQFDSFEHVIGLILLFQIQELLLFGPALQLVSSESRLYHSSS